jgi:hypothetical protein
MKKSPLSNGNAASLGEFEIHDFRKKLMATSWRYRSNNEAYKSVKINTKNDSICEEGL